LGRYLNLRAACPVASLPDLALPGLDFFVATERSLAPQSRTRKSREQAEISILVALYFLVYFLLCY
jgi:hypothetical protein